ncbi:TIGR02206 family membrane protein [Ornithinimicrobium sp. Y1847]|uniref:TMEM164-related integral membrane acyltransferase n=1 Tax=Ornithinimicrobium sp. Y1847 TaxID=3405419 RepID=UPI003B67FDCE
MVLSWHHPPPLLEIGGRDHAAYLALYLTLLVLLLTRKELIKRRKELVRRLAIVVVVVQQVAMYSYHLTHREGLEQGLPLHVCRVTSLVGLVWLLTGADWAMQLVFHFGVFAYGSLAYPWGNAPVTHAMGWSFAVNHVVTLLLPVLAAVTEEWWPTREGLVTSIVAFLGYLAVTDRVNQATGANYFYLRERPFLQGLGRRGSIVVGAVGGCAVMAGGYAVSRLLARARG